MPAASCCSGKCRSEPHVAESQSVCEFQPRERKYMSEQRGQAGESACRHFAQSMSMFVTPTFSVCQRRKLQLWCCTRSTRDKNKRDIFASVVSLQ